MFVTTIKHAKQLLSIFLAFLLICQSAVAAGQKTKYELGLEAAAGNKWDIAIRYFKAVSEDDPQYKDARKQIVIAQEEQDKSLAKSKFQNDFKKETDKCRNLFEIERSPDTQRCIERVNELHREGNEKFGSLQLASYEALTADYSPYRTINEVTDRVRGIAMDINGIDNAGNDLMFIESFVADPKMPDDAKVIGAIVGTQIFKGATLAFSQACEDARAGTDQKAADTICNRQQVALQKYASFRNFVIEKSPALAGKSVPLLIWNDYNPLSQTVSALPQPDALVVVNSKNTNTNSNTPRIATGSYDSSSKSSVIPPSMEEEKSSWVPYAIGGGVGLLGAIGLIWKLTAKNVATTSASTAAKPSAMPTSPVGTSATASQRGGAGSPKSKMPLVQAVAQATTTVSSIASSPEIANLKNLIKDWSAAPTIAKAKDGTLTALVEFCAKLGVDVEQTGRGKTVALLATLKNPESVSELAAEIMRLVLQARR